MTHAQARHYVLFQQTRKLRGASSRGSIRRETLAGKTVVLSAEADVGGWRLEARSKRAEKVQRCGEVVVVVNR